MTVNFSTTQSTMWTKFVILANLATAELLVKVKVINCHYTSASGSMNIYMKLIKLTLVMFRVSRSIAITGLIVTPAVSPAAELIVTHI